MGRQEKRLSHQRQSLLAGEAPFPSAKRGISISLPRSTLPARRLEDASSKATPPAETEGHSPGVCQEDRFSLLQRLQKRDSGDADAEVRRFGASLDWRPLWLISSILRERASHLCSQMNTLNRNERGGRCGRTIQMVGNAFICQKTALRLRVGRLSALRCPTIAFESMPAGCGSCSRSKEGRTDGSRAENPLLLQRPSTL